jgi:hypothetical protein
MGRAEMPVPLEGVEKMEIRKDEKVSGENNQTVPSGTNVQGQKELSPAEKFLQEQLEQLRRKVSVLESMRGRDIKKELEQKTDEFVKICGELSALIEVTTVANIPTDEYRKKISDAVKPILPQSAQTQTTTQRKRGGSNFEDRVREILTAQPDRKMKETELKAKLMEEYSINTVGSRVGQMVSNSQLVREGEYIRLP